MSRELSVIFFNPSVYCPMLYWFIGLFTNLEKLDEELRLANSWSGLGGNRGDNSEVSATNVRCDVSEVAATNGTDSLAAVDSTSEITNKNTAVRNSSDSPGTDAES